MKKETLTLITILGLLIIVLISVFKTTETPITNVFCGNINPASNERCDLYERMPRNPDELPNEVFLTYDLEDKCNFQPIHVQIREGEGVENHSSQIIARFKAWKTMEKGVVGYFIDEIELMHWEISSEPRDIRIAKASIKKHNEDAGIDFQIEIVLKGDAKTTYKLDDVELNRNEPDTIIKNCPFFMPMGCKIDIKVVKNDYYPNDKEEGLDENERIKITYGKQCTGIIK